MSKRSRGWQVSIRWSLFISLLLVIVLISGGLLLYSLLGARRAIEHLSQSLIGQASDRAEERLDRFFSPIARSIETVRDLGNRGVFVPEDTRSANRVLLPILLAIPQMASVNTGNERGDVLLVVKRKGEWLNISAQGGAKAGDWSLVDEMGRVLKIWRQEVEFDPRSRPWYEGARKALNDAVYWTEPYAFVPTGDVGITASVKVNGPRGQYVLAFDILLEEFSKFAGDIHVSPRGKVFVLTDDDRFLAPPSDGSGELDEMLLKQPWEVNLPLVEEGVRLRAERPRGAPFRFQHEGESWWCGFKPYQIGLERRFWIGVMIPEEDVLGDTVRDRFALMVLTLAALALAILMSLILSRAYSEPLKNLVLHSSRLERLETGDEIRLHSRLKEVRRLADAQENMRRALDSFARYVPIEVVRELLDRGEAATIGGRDVDVTVLFTDIVGFTSIAESMSPGDLTTHMSEYFDGVIGILQRHGATVDKLIGDAVMAFWGAPEPVPDSSHRAVEAVMEIREWLAQANQRWIHRGLPELPTRFGLAMGEVTVGNVGAHHRLSYTALGDPVNLANRLEALNSQTGTWVLADENVAGRTGDVFTWREMAPMEIRGKAQPVRVFELLGRR